MSEAPITPLPGSTYRLVVRSADEAVRIIQEKLGPNARVISVRQIGARGFASLLRAPQLEVIAEVPAATEEKPAPPAPSEPVAENEIAWLNEEAAKITVPPAAAPVTPSVPAPAPWPAEESRPSLDRLLLRAGVSESTLDLLRRSPRWTEIHKLPLSASLSEAVEILRTQWQENVQKPIGPRVAFFGPPGSGSTTALCKAMTMDVFFRQQSAVVLKLDGEQPNPTEGLAVFCEALGIPLLRTADELEAVPEGARLYFDATGFPLHDAPAWRNLGRLLGEFYIDTRVLVLNAAYETDLLKQGYTVGREAGATHVVFTHLDELPRWGKLWEPVLRGGLQPLFFSCGQNVSGDISESPFQHLISKTFGLRI